MRALGYCRVSSLEQATGTSLRDQQAAIEAHAKARGVALAHVYVEAESGIHESNEKREQMQALLRDVKRGDLVLCDKLDRWSRDPEFTYGSVRRILAAGAAFYAVGDACDPSTSEGDTMMGFRILVAREEHKRIKERMVGTRKKLRAAGYYAEGKPPLGYARRDVKGPERNVLVIVPEEAETVRGIFAACIAGRSHREIARDVGLSDVAVWRVLRSRVYLAEAPARWPAIVDAGTWAQAHSALDARRLGGARPRGGDVRTSGWVLRDVATCAECGRRMSAAWAGRYEYYICCAYVPRAPADAAACALVLARLVDLRAELASEEPSSPRPVADVAGARAKLARRRARYLELAAGDLMTDDELRAALTRVDDELRGLEEAPRDARPRRERLAEVDTLARAWEAATGAERRAIVRELAVSVAVSRAGVVPLWRSPR